MARRVPREEALTILRGPPTAHRLWTVLQSLPEGVEPALVASAALTLLTNHQNAWRFARYCRVLPGEAIREVLRRKPITPEAFILFLHSMIDPAAPDPVVEAQWDLALRAWLDLQTSYAWGSKQKRAKLNALAHSPDVVSAGQAAVAGGGALVPIDLLAVLSIDASDPSIDALLAYFTVAASDRGQALQRLKMIKTHAADTPPMRAMLAGVDQKLSERSAASPALEIAAAMGLPELKELKFSVYLGCVELNAHHVPRYQVNFSVDSQAPVWFHFACTRLIGVTGQVERTAFNAEKIVSDAIGLGACPAVEIPHWLERAAQKLEVTWAFEGVKPHSPLRGKKREALMQWLSGSALSNSAP